MKHYLLLIVIVSYSLMDTTVEAKPTMNTGAQHFFSSNNPAATIDQKNLELLALKIADTKEYKQGRQGIENMWRAVSGSDPSEQDWTLFEDTMDEYAFNYALKSVNSDPNYPKVLSAIYGPAHQWFGEQFPASRLGGDSPDNHYVFIPIDDKATYRITGKRNTPAPVNVTWQLATNVMFSQAPSMVDASEFEYDADGSFVVTLGAKKQPNTKNYLQTSDGVRFLFIRETRSDWRQVPSALRVERIDPPTAPPLTFEQMADRARNYMLHDVPQVYWFARVGRAIPVNTMGPPFITGSIGGHRLQKISFGNLRIEDDEAYVVTAGSGNADYYSFTLQDIWYRTINYPNRLSSYNNTQSVPNSDGSITYVVAHKDPGVHNWLDTTGLRNLSPLYRWQALPLTEESENPPIIEGKLVKFKDLDKALPDTMKRVSPQQREQQLKQRKEDYMLRWVDK